MDVKRVTEWLATAEGLGKAVAAFLGLPALIWAAVTKLFDPVGLPRWVTFACAALVTAVIGFLLWRSFRRFDRASRLERPDAFTLRPVGPESLIGRADELAKLLKSVKQYRLVLLDGESGCGKSALVFAGLNPQLHQQPDGLLPVPIRDWGDDWARGPLSTAVDALFNSVSRGDREKLGWIASPDLAADIPELAADLDGRLKAVFHTLGRRPLIVADQFDDHQAHHRSRFLDDEANWLTPTLLARSNPFWGVVSAGLAERRLHLLVVTRADTAAGLACVRFLGEDQTVARTLPRVEAEYLRPLLANIAPDDAQPPVVSNPAGGWLELRELLEDDLKAEGAVLMQQVRTALLGVRQLPLLTPGRYRSAGGLRGVETLVISRALRRAGDTVGGGDANLQVARNLLGELILPGPNQPPKSQRATLSDLSNVAGNNQRAEAILGILQNDEVVRPAEAVGDTNAWQLDHDYLARAVLAEARQSDRWSVALREGRARYEAATRDWKRRWSALLPFGTLMRVCWERARNRLTFGDAANYVRMSAIKPATVALGLALFGIATYVAYRELLVMGEAYALVSEFGTKFARSATLRVWSAPEPIRQRVYSILVPKPDARAGSEALMLEGALFSGWPSAHAGLEPARAREAASSVRTQLQREPDPGVASRLANIYTALAARLDEADARAEATILRTRLEQERNNEIASSLATAYAAVAVRVTDAADLKSAVALLRARLLQEKGFALSESSVAYAYAALAARLDNADAKAEATILRARLEQESDGEMATTVAKAYAAIAVRLPDAADAKTAATLLRKRIEQQRDNLEVSASKPTRTSRSEQIPFVDIGQFGQAYATVAVRLNEADVKSEATTLGLRLEQERDNLFANSLEEAYSAVAVRLTEAEGVKVAATLLRARLFQKEQSGVLESAADHALAEAYAIVATRLAKKDMKAEATILRARLEQEHDGEIVSSLSKPFAAVEAQLAESTEVKSAAMLLRARLEQKGPDELVDYRVAEAYAAVAARLDEADARTESTILRSRFEQNRDSEIASGLAMAYAAVAIRLTDAADVKAAAIYLRARLEQELAASLVPSSRLANNLPGVYVPALRQAYATVAVLLNEADVKAEATTLRTRLEQERDVRIAGGLAESFAAVAVRLSDTANIAAAATLLGERMEGESFEPSLDHFARAYAQLASAIFAQADANGRTALTVEILTLAGHPFLSEIAPLLAALKPSAKRDFGEDTVAAVTWAGLTYGIRPGQLRPSPEGR